MSCSFFAPQEHPEFDSSQSSLYHLEIACGLVSPCTATSLETSTPLALFLALSPQGHWKNKSVAQVTESETGLGCNEASSFPGSSGRTHGRAVFVKHSQRASPLNLHIVYGKGSWVLCPSHHAPTYHGGDLKLPDGFDHAEAHFNAAVGMVLAGLRQPGNTVVAVAQDFDPKAVMLLEGTGWERQEWSQQTASERLGKEGHGVGCLHLGVRSTCL